MSKASKMTNAAQDLSTTCKRVCRCLHNITAVNTLISDAAGAESMDDSAMADPNLACLFNNIDREDCADEGVVGAVLQFKNGFTRVLIKLCNDVESSGDPPFSKIDGVISNYTAMFDFLEAVDAPRAQVTASAAHLRAFISKVNVLPELYKLHKSKSTAPHWDSLHKGVLTFLNSFGREQDQCDVVKSMATALMEHSLAACLAYHEACTKAHVDKKKTELQEMTANFSKVCLGPA